MKRPLYDINLAKIWGKVKEKITSSIGTVVEDVSEIKEKIPSQASSTNKLADKEFVNSSISTNTATFRGTYTSADDFPQTATNNDYVFLQVVNQTTGLVDRYDRYKWTGSEWEFEYSLNNSSFTAAQWETINSAITSGQVEYIMSAIEELYSQVDGKQDLITSANKLSSDLVSGLSAVAKTGSYDDLSDLPTELVSYDEVGQAEGGIPYATKGYVDDSVAGKADKSSLSNVATSGEYSDLKNRPTIPAKVSELQNDSSFTTKTYVDGELAKKTDDSSLAPVAKSGDYEDLSNIPPHIVTCTDVETAEGGIPYATKGYVDDAVASKANTADLKAVATSGSYNDLKDKPTIPAKVSELQNDRNYINDPNTVIANIEEDAIDFAALSLDDKVSQIVQDLLSSGVATLSYNSLSGKSSIPTKTSELQNNSGFVTMSDVESYFNQMLNSLSNGTY